MGIVLEPYADGGGLCFDENDIHAIEAANMFKINIAMSMVRGKH